MLAQLRTYKATVVYKEYDPDKITYFVNKTSGVSGWNYKKHIETSVDEEDSRYIVVIYEYCATRASLESFKVDLKSEVEETISLINDDETEPNKIINYEIKDISR